MDLLSKSIAVAILICVIVILVLSTMTKGEDIEYTPEILVERIFILKTKNEDPLKYIAIELREKSRTLIYNIEYPDTEAFIVDTVTGEETKIELENKRGCALIKDLPSETVQRFKEGRMEIRFPSGEQLMLFIVDSYETYKE